MEAAAAVDFEPPERDFALEEEGLKLAEVEPRSGVVEEELGELLMKAKREAAAVVLLGPKKAAVEVEVLLGLMRMVAEEVVLKELMRWKLAAVVEVPAVRKPM